MNGLLIAVVILLAVITVVQVMKIFELSGEINGGKDNDVTEKDNQMQGTLMLVIGFLFVISVAAMFVGWSDILLPRSASEHGLEIDSLFNWSMFLISVVFFIVQPVLFYFAYKYRGVKGRKATYYEHNNKLELIWTVVPAMVLCVLIIWGLNTWGDIMNPDNEEQPIVVELYAQQFAWTARYSGGDNELGYANVNLIEGSNALGVDLSDPNAGDDFTAKEIHLPVGKSVLFKFRSQDVIHSAFMPHFRAQMNCVPGMVTQFQFKPTVTSEEMSQDPHVVKQITEINEIRAKNGEDPYDFGYLVLCNKICGSAHYNMQLPIIVESEEAYEKWVKEQKTLAEAL